MRLPLPPPRPACVCVYTTILIIKSLFFFKDTTSYEYVSVRILSVQYSTIRSTVNKSLQLLLYYILCVCTYTAVQHVYLHV